MDTLLQDLELTLDQIVGYPEFERKAIGFQKVHPQLMEAHLQQELVELPLQEGMSKESVDELPQRAILVGFPARLDSSGFGGRTGLVVDNLGLDTIELFADGNVIAQIELLRPDPNAVRHATCRQGEEGGHEGIDDGREEHEEVDLGEHILHVLVPISGVGLGEVDGELHYAQCGYCACMLRVEGKIQRAG